MSQRALICSDIWCEISEGGSILMVATEQRGLPETILAAFNGARVTLARKTFIRGHTVFESSEWHPADAPNPSAADQAWLLAGPSRGALSSAP